MWKTAEVKFVIGICGDRDGLDQERSHAGLIARIKCSVFGVRNWNYPVITSHCVELPCCSGQPWFMYNGAASTSRSHSVHGLIADHLVISIAALASSSLRKWMLPPNSCP